MKYLVSFYGRNIDSFRDGTSIYCNYLKLLIPNLTFKIQQEMTRADFVSNNCYSVGNCKEFDTFSEAVEFYTAVTPCFHSVVLATTEGNIICEYHFSNFN